MEISAKTDTFLGCPLSFEYCLDDGAEIDSNQILCPACGKPAGEGKFYNNCGSSLSLVKRQRCGASSPAGTRFCGECGNKM